MTVEKFEEIKNKVKKIELENATSRGKIEAIESSWNKKYGFTSIEDARKKRDEMKAAIDEKTAKRNELMNKLEKSYDWDSV